MANCTKCGGYLILNSLKSNDDRYDCLLLTCNSCGIIVDKQFMKRSKDDSNED